jgi:predicted branched-subunit amino acid permease
MKETSNIFSAMITAMGMMVSNFYSHLAPWLLFGMVLVLVDLRFGILAAKSRKEEIRLSRMLRRTINKMIDYLCWVTVAEFCSRTFGIVIGFPIVSMATLFVIYGIELNSCVNNYLEYKGIKKKWNFFRLVGKEDLLEDAEDKI